MNSTRGLAAAVLRSALALRRGALGLFFLLMIVALPPVAHAHAGVPDMTTQTDVTGVTSVTVAVDVEQFSSDCCVGPVNSASASHCSGSGSCAPWALAASGLPNLWFASATARLASLLLLPAGVQLMPDSEPPRSTPGA